jgi:uncharacterized protein (TIGR04222 family)
MDWLFDNPIGKMSGPAFLTLYAVWFIFWLFVARYVGTSKPASPPNPLSIPLNPNPFHIAYLRGGIPEVFRTVFVDLVEKKRLIEVEPDRKLYRFVSIPTKWVLANPMDLGQDLTQFHAILINGLRHNPCSIQDAMMQTRNEFARKGLELRITLETLGLIQNERQLRRFQALSLATIIGFSSLGIYKLLAAITHGHFNIFLLVAGTFVGAVMLILVGQRTAITERGSQYLKDLRIAFSALKSPSRRRDYLPNNVFSDQLSPTVLAMGIFGLIAIQNSELDPLLHAFGPQGLAASSHPTGWTNQIASGCGSGGCGSGGCGSGGCGSGGCGSGGCGSGGCGSGGCGSGGCGGCSG